MEFSVLGHFPWNAVPLMTSIIAPPGRGARSKEERMKDARVQDEETKDELITGKTIACWLAGEKYLLQKWGVFSNYFNLLGFELTEECRQFIDRIAEEEAAFLLP